MTLLQVLAWGGAWALGWFLIGRGHRLDGWRVREGRPIPSVSVIIPARNEATRLPPLLRAMHDMPIEEVLVVDDGSTDATATVAASLGATVVFATPLPPQWTGKAWACATGADVASGEVIVFLDADVEPTWNGLRALVDAADATGGLVSAHPSHHVEQLHECASVGPALVTLLGAGTGPSSRRRWWRGPVAFGPAIAITRSAYASFGGHAAVADAVDDDLALAGAADRAGVPVTALIGGDLVRYRMYPDGIAQLVEGWTKNLATGAATIPRLRLVACVLWVAAALSTTVSLATHMSAVLGLTYVAYAGQAHVALRRLGFRRWAIALLFPVALVVFLGLFTMSVIAKLRGTVRWRGRDIPVGVRT